MTGIPSAPVGLVAPNGTTGTTAVVGVARLHRRVPARTRQTTRVLPPTILLTIIGTIALTVGAIRSRARRRMSLRARPSDRSSPSFRARSIIPGAWAERVTWYPSSNNSSLSQPRTATFDRAENVVEFSAEGGAASSLCPLWQLPRTPSYGLSRGRRCPCPRRIPHNHRPVVTVIRWVRPCSRSSRRCTRHNPKCACPAPTRVAR